jgi:transcriptional regulator with XRE-family HTH domain
MFLNDRLRSIREAKQLSQVGMAAHLGCSVADLSLVENGDTVPSVDVLEKCTEALGVPLYELFFDAEHPAVFPNLPGRLTANDIALKVQKKPV